MCRLRSAVGLTRRVTARSRCRSRLRMCRSSRSSGQMLGFQPPTANPGNGTAVAASRPDAGRRAHLQARRVGGMLNAPPDGGAVKCWAKTVGSGTTRMRSRRSRSASSPAAWEPGSHACSARGDWDRSARCWGWATRPVPARRVTGGVSPPRTQVTGLSSGVVQITAGWGIPVRPHPRRAWSNRWGWATPTGNWEWVHWSAAVGDPVTGRRPLTRSR